MNNVKKLTAVVIATSMLAACAGCGDQSWSYKTDNVSLSAGSYIYNLLNGYYEGYDLVESPDEIKDILKAEVQGSDSDAEKKSLEQYALDVADETTSRMIAVEALFDQYGLELDDTEDEAARSYASQVWTTAKKTLEGYGIGEESFNYCYADYSVKYGQVFEYVYGEDGERTVSDDDLKKYFADNFTGYAFFSYSMSETTEDGETIAKSDEEFKKAEENFNSYADIINKSGQDYKSAVKKFIEDYEMTYDPTYSGAIENENDNSSFDRNVIDTLKTLKEGEATVVKTGEDATTLYYLVYRPKASEIEDYLTNDATSSTPATDPDGGVYIYDLKSGYTRYTLLDKMKGDDFTQFLKDTAASLNIQKNETAIKGYKVKMFVQDSDED